MSSKVMVWRVSFEGGREVEVVTPVYASAEYAAKVARTDESTTNLSRITSVRELFIATA